jgi:diguanylate cyclase (GGDEF)-like protein
VRLITRNDTSLAVGLIAAAIVVFQQPLRYVWDIAQDVERRYHVDLVPALTILTGVFVFHEYRKRQLAKAETRAAAAEATQARTRSEELERLMAFGQALANALEPSALQQVLWRYLPTFAHEREFWVLTRKGDRWEAFLQNTTDDVARSVEVLEALAERAMSPEIVSEARIDGILEAETVCFPMLAGGAAVGVLGIHDASSLTRDERKAIGAAAAVLAIAVRNVQLFLETREHGLRDSLTGCFNRGHGLESLDRELRLARRTARPLSVLMFDIDHFKSINDQLGHLRGDDLLRAVGAELTRLLRSTDVRCRYGGDEFLIILPDTHVLGAEQVAESLRREISTLNMTAGGRTLSVTASVGVATAAAGELDLTAVIERADEALYQAKRAGRNRFCVAIPPASTSPSLTSEPQRISLPARTG